jgi:hypothetical protein
MNIYSWDFNSVIKLWTLSRSIDCHWPVLSISWRQGISKGRDGRNITICVWGLSSYFRIRSSELRINPCFTSIFINITRCVSRQTGSLSRNWQIGQFDNIWGKEWRPAGDVSSERLKAGALCVASGRKFEKGSNLPISCYFSSVTFFVCCWRSGRFSNVQPDQKGSITY